LVSMAGVYPARGDRFNARRYRFGRI